MVQFTINAKNNVLQSEFYNILHGVWTNKPKYLFYLLNPRFVKTTMLIHGPIQTDSFSTAAEFKHNKGSPLACKQQEHGLP